MASLVTELQRLAIEKGDITELLRKALIVATKLKMKEFQTWISEELHGQEKHAPPSYRIIPAALVAFNPVNGQWIHIHNLPSNVAQKMSKAAMFNPISEIEALTKREKATNVFISVAPEFEQLINDNSQARIPMKVAQAVTIMALHSIIDVVRTTILEWALKLESEGIMGEGVEFSATEQRAAVQNINIQQFTGVLGNVGANAQVGDMPTMSFAQPETKETGKIAKLTAWVKSHAKLLSAIAGFIVAASAVYVAVKHFGKSKDEPATMPATTTAATASAPATAATTPATKTTP